MAADGRAAAERFVAANPGIRITRAIIANPLGLDRDMLLARRIIAPDTDYDPPARAAALVHVSAWRDCAASGLVTHVADHRAILRERFAGLIAPHVAAADGFDLIVWGYDFCEPVEIGLAAGIDGRLIHNTAGPPPDFAAFRASAASAQAFALRGCGAPCGYTLSPAGAARLLALCLPFDAPPLVYFADSDRPCRSAGHHVAMARHYAGLLALVLQPVLAVLPADPARSCPLRHFRAAFSTFAVEHARASPLPWPS